MRNGLRNFQTQVKSAVLPFASPLSVGSSGQTDQSDHVQVISDWPVSLLNYHKRLAKVNITTAVYRSENSRMRNISQFKIPTKRAHMHRFSSQSLDNQPKTPVSGDGFGLKHTIEGDVLGHMGRR